MRIQISALRVNKAFKRLPLHTSYKMPLSADVLARLHQGLYFSDAWSHMRHKRKKVKMDQPQAIECFSAMAQESRLSIFKLLMRKSPEGLRVMDVSKKLGIVPSTLSGHLSVLKRSGLLNSRRNQREIYYSANLETINDLMLFIVEECCDGNLGSCEKTFRLLLSNADI